MSEYQYIEFRAADRPLTDKELAFAEKQSSRAQVTRWRFSNEYHYSGFRGDVDGLLRRGYDVFLQYASYGERTLKIRLPELPFGKKLVAKYVDGDRLKWKKDRKGNAGILTLEPFYEEIEPIWEGFDDCLDELIAVRQRLIEGDLRALFALWLCVAGDQNFELEAALPPVPFGLSGFDSDLDSLFAFFDVDPLTMAAAVDGAKFPETSASDMPTIHSLTLSGRIQPWLQSLTAKQAKEHLEELLVGDASAVKATLLSKVTKERARAKQKSWPTVETNRTVEDLFNQCEKLRETADAKTEKKKRAKAKREAIKAEKIRNNRMAEMVKDPKKWLAESERLVAARGTANYEEAAKMLADLREAVGGAKGTKLTRDHAAHLSRKHPTLSRLKGSLRKHGVLS